jgi:hypothetical protein
VGGHAAWAGTVHRRHLLRRSPTAIRVLGGYLFRIVTAVTDQPLYVVGERIDDSPEPVLAPQTNAWPAVTAWAIPASSTSGTRTRTGQSRSSLLVPAPLSSRRSSRAMASSVTGDRTKLRSDPGATATVSSSIVDGAPSCELFRLIDLETKDTACRRLLLCRDVFGSRRRRVGDELAEARHLDATRKRNLHRCFGRRWFIRKQQCPGGLETQPNRAASIVPPVDVGAQQ